MTPFHKNCIIEEKNRTELTGGQTYENYQKNTSGGAYFGDGAYYCAYF